MELELNSLDWNGNELEHELELEDMKRTQMYHTGHYKLGWIFAQISIPQ